MQLEETIAKELADIIKGQVTATTTPMQAQIDAVREALVKSVDELTHKLGEQDAPADIIDEISKAIAMLAEAPPLAHGKDNGPVVVQFAPPVSKRTKTITTRRDDKGNLVARVVEDAD